jgi:Uma2 family endonuclease
VEGLTLAHIRGPDGGWTDEALDALPECVRYEIEDGHLVLLPGCLGWHQVAARWLANQVEASCLRSWLPVTQCLICVYDGDVLAQARRPDVMVIPRALVGRESERGHAEPHEVPLVVEVGAPKTRIADQVTKVGVYAAWGIPLYLRLEVEPDTAPVLFEYRLGDDGRYGEPAMHTDEFRIDEPFPLVIRVADLQWRG